MEEEEEEEGEEEEDVDKRRRRGRKKRRGGTGTTTTANQDEWTGKEEGGAATSEEGRRASMRHRMRRLEVLVAGLTHRMEEERHASSDAISSLKKKVELLEEELRSRSESGSPRRKCCLTSTSTKVRRSHTIAGTKDAAARLRVSFQMDATFAPEDERRLEVEEVDGGTRSSGRGRHNHHHFEEVEHGGSKALTVESQTNLSALPPPLPEEEKEKEEGLGSDVLSSSPPPPPPSATLASRTASLGILPPLPSAVLEEEEEEEEELEDEKGPSRKERERKRKDFVLLAKQSSDEGEEKTASSSPSSRSSPILIRPSSTPNASKMFSTSASSPNMPRSFSYNDLVSSADYELCMLSPSTSPVPGQSSESLLTFLENKKNDNDPPRGSISAASSPVTSMKRQRNSAHNHIGGLFFDFGKRSSSSSINRTFGSFRRKGSASFRSKNNSNSFGKDKEEGETSSSPKHPKLKSLKKQQRLSWNEEFESQDPQNQSNKSNNNNNGSSNNKSNNSKPGMMSVSTLDLSHEDRKQQPPWVIADPANLRQIRDLFTQPRSIIKCGHLDLKRGAGAFKGYRSMWCALTEEGDLYAFDASSDVDNAMPRLAWRLAAGRWAVKMVSEGGKDLKKQSHPDKKKRSRYFLLIPPQNREDNSVQSNNHLNSILLHHNHQGPNEPRQFQAANKDDAETWVDAVGRIILKSQLEAHTERMNSASMAETAVVTSNGTLGVVNPVQHRRHRSMSAVVAVTDDDDNAKLRYTVCVHIQYKHRMWHKLLAFYDFLFVVGAIN